MRAVFCLLLVLSVALAGDQEEAGLEQPPTSIKARRLREEASDRWLKASETWEKASSNKPVTPEEAAAALPLLEEAVELWEKSLHVEWHAEANRTLALAVRAWHKLRPLVPPPPEPTDEDAKKKAEKEKKRAARKHTKAIREFIMDYGAARRYTSQFKRCPKCEGRKELRSPFGGKPRPCTVCEHQGRLVDRDGIIAARWLVYSPLYRQESRNARDVDRALRIGARKPESLAPFIRSVHIVDIEDHDVWARVKTKEKFHNDPFTRNSEKRVEEYLLYRVGDTWWLYSERYDRRALELPEEERPSGSG